MKIKRQNRKWKNQRGWMGLILCIFIAAIVVGAGFLIASALVGEVKQADKASHEANVRKISFAVQPDGGQALNLHTHFLANFLQLKYNKATTKGGSELDRQRLHQLCMDTFPLYHVLEMRGATLVSGTSVESFSEWNKVRGTGTVEIRYNGIIPTRRIPGNNLDPNEWPWAVSVTYTFPYTIEKYAFPVPEDGSHADFGGLWRFTRPVSTWSPIKGGGGSGGGTGDDGNGTLGRQDAGEPNPAPTGKPRVLAKYDNIIEMDAYIAIARQDVNEPFNGELPGILAEPPTACDPNEPVHVIPNNELGGCTVGNCAVHVASNFPPGKCDADASDKDSPAAFAAQYNKGLFTKGKIEGWIGVGVQFMHDRHDRVGAKYLRNFQFTPTIMGQTTQPFFPNGSSMLQTQVYATKPVPILAQNWRF